MHAISGQVVREPRADLVGRALWGAMGIQGGVPCPRGQLSSVPPGAGAGIAKRAQETYCRRMVSIRPPAFRLASSGAGRLTSPAGRAKEPDPLHSLILLILVAFVLAVPGIAASLAVFAPSEVPIVTRSAAAFGLGYAASGGCALALAAIHAFRLSFFIPLWVAVSAVLWVVALRRASLRDHVHALGDDIDKNRLPLLLGALVIAGFLILHIKFITIL